MSVIFSKLYFSYIYIYREREREREREKRGRKRISIDRSIDQSLSTGLGKWCVVNVERDSHTDTHTHVLRYAQNEYPQIHRVGEGGKSLIAQSLNNKKIRISER